MSLLYALHYNKLGACPLNWSVERNVEKKLKKKLKIPDSENIIMSISVGHIPNDLSVATSPRK